MLAVSRGMEIFVPKPMGKTSSPDFEATDTLHNGRAEIQDKKGTAIFDYNLQKTHIGTLAGARGVQIFVPNLTGKDTINNVRAEIQDKEGTAIHDYSIRKGAHQHAVRHARLADLRAKADGQGHHRQREGRGQATIGQGGAAASAHCSHAPRAPLAPAAAPDPPRGGRACSCCETRG